MNEILCLDHQNLRGFELLLAQVDKDEVRTNEQVPYMKVLGGSLGVGIPKVAMDKTTLIEALSM